MTNADKIKNDIRDMPIEKLASFIYSCPYVGEYRHSCPIRHIDCIECKKEWLSKEIDDPKEELKGEPKKKPTLPRIIRTRINLYTNEYGRIHQIEAITDKINEIIDYLKEKEDEQTD